MKEISVVMATYNRGNLLLRGLMTLIRQDVLPHEIVIVDDGSRDGTDEIVRNFQKKYPEANIEYYYNDNPGWNNPCIPKNIGIKKATKELILLTEPEILHATPVEIGIILDFFNGNSVYGDKIFLRAIKLYRVRKEALKMLKEENFLNPLTITSLHNVRQWYEGHKGYRSSSDTITYFPTGGTHNIAAVPKKYLMEVGGYDEELRDIWGYEDTDLIGRLYRYGLYLLGHRYLIAIHLYHDSSPPGNQRKVTTGKNYNIYMEHRKKGIWKVNVDKEWGILRG